ncbi:MAG: ribbon-helix-helix domain-containing protein [Candidatus Woesearchaeota archaeon]|jgi:metal-responsive CopG/Arc/MetJ family transcriptional regulator|nr:ribbon-helix-helix domain-containing protein [Candidatus Woesearchaeota archaeon]|tara:strand:- start:777 stop:908 length:132 start_codon:yes stop_codon:yes gene_type:complete
MKQVFTISIDEKLVDKIRSTYRKKRFRNKSHLVEEAIEEFLRK